jgi:hypothetical protein
MALLLRLLSLWGPAAMAEPRLSDGAGAEFAMVRIGSGGLVLEALRNGAIEPSDVAILWTVVMNLNWRSGRCWASPAELAAALSINLEAVEQALDRLLAAGLVVVGKRLSQSRRPYLAVHPLVCTTGGPYRRRWQWLQFHRHAADPGLVEQQAAALGAARSPLAS